MPIAVRYTQDAFSRSGWLWPVDAKGEPLKATSYMAVGFYVAKYVNKKSDMDLAAKGLGAKEWNNSLKTKLSLLPKKLFRIRMSRNFGMKMLTMTNLSTSCRLALLPFLISCLIWLDLVASLPLIKERILVIILLLHFLSLMLGSVLVLMLPLLVWLTPDLRIKKSLLKCNWTIRKRLPRCKMRLKKRLLAFSRRLHARIRKTRYMHKMRCLLINRRSLLLALRLLWKTPIFPSNSRFPRLCAKCLLKLKRLVSILPMTKSKK